MAEAPPVMASEDFSAFARADPAIRSLLFWVGAQPRARWDAAAGDLTRLPSLHSPRFDFNDAIIGDGIRLWRDIAAARLARA